MKKIMGALVLMFVPIGVFAQTAAPAPAQSPVDVPYRDTVFAAGENPDTKVEWDLKRKLGTHASRMFSFPVVVFYAADAGVAQATNTPGKWGQGAEAYGKRFANLYGQNVIRETLSFGLDGLFKTDPRVYRSRKTSFGGRLGDAFVQTLVRRTDSGKHVVNVAGIGSAFAAGQIARAWLPTRDASFGDGVYYGALFLAGDFGRNVCKEFWPDVKRMFHH
jgi:hypothetical protein